jgi:hypothetical protein
MKSLFCSFCRTKQDRVYGLTPDPDAYCICAACLQTFNDAPAQPLPEPCCFCTAAAAGYMEASSGATICRDCVVKFLLESKNPQKETPVDEIEEILIQWPVYFDSTMDLIEVQVRLKDGSLWNANFTTPGRIPWEMEKGKRNGQWAEGTCFWHPDLVFVEELTEDIIRKAVAHLSQNRMLQKAFRRHGGQG